MIINTDKSSIWSEESHTDRRQPCWAGEQLWPQTAGSHHRQGRTDGGSIRSGWTFGVQSGVNNSIIIEGHLE